MKIIKIGVSVLFLTLALTSCGKLTNDVSKTVAGWGSGTYLVTVWSGGKAVREYRVEGFVNTETGSDGWFFIHNGKLVRVAGTVTIERQ